MPHYSEKLTEHWQRKYTQLIYEQKQNAKLVADIVNKLSDNIKEFRDAAEWIITGQTNGEGIDGKRVSQGINKLVRAINNSKKITDGK